MPGPGSAIQRGILLGVLISILVVGLGKIPGLRPPPSNPDLFARLDYSHGWPRAIWVIITIALSPLVEEILFRGILYGGYRRSFGPQWAAILTTLLFVACHGPKAASNFPFLIGLVAGSLASLWCRLNSGAVGPAVGVHLGYNLARTFIILVARATR